MWQRIAIGVTNKLRWCCIANEIALIAWLTPSTLRIPVPGLDIEFGILPIGDGLPSRGEDSLEDRLREELVRGHSRDAVNSSAQSFRRAKGIGRVIRCDIYMDGLC